MTLYQVKCFMVTTVRIYIYFLVLELINRVYSVKDLGIIFNIINYEVAYYCSNLSQIRFCHW